MSTEVEEDDVKANPAWKIALVGMPLFLALSGAWAIWSYVQRHQEQADSTDQRLALAASAVTEAQFESDMGKLRDLIGPRDWETAEGTVSLRRAIAFIDGTLSPQNYGFVVKRGMQLPHGGDLWPTLWVDLDGSPEVVVVAAPYDGSDSAIAGLLSAVNDLRDETFERTVRIVFYPSAIPRKMPAWEKVLEGGERVYAIRYPDGVAGPVEEGLIGLAPGNSRAWDGGRGFEGTQSLVEEVRKLATTK